MCIFFVATDPDPPPGGFRLIAASNRDEYYSRPSETAKLRENGFVIGGIDLEEGREGGMWLGASLHRGKGYVMRLGALLNVTGEEKKSQASGRGFVITNCFTSENTTDYLKQLVEPHGNYNAFNFVVVELDKDACTIHYQSNSPSDYASFKGKQVLTFGNSPLSSPLRKVSEGKKRFTEIIEQNHSVATKTKLQSELFQLLRWKERNLPDAELQRRAPRVFEHLSSVFVEIKSVGYGTRAHTLVLVDSDWNVDFVEMTVDKDDPLVWHRADIKCRL